MIIIDGKKVAEEKLQKLKSDISALNTLRKPCIALVLVGENPASMSYVKMKKKKCISVGIKSIIEKLDLNTSEENLLLLLEKLNLDENVDGILVQMPLPPHIDTLKVINAIDPDKDVDGFSPINMGKLLIGEKDFFAPCTPMGIKTLIQEYNIQTEGKHVVICGRSNIVGKPLAALLVQRDMNATVTLAYSHTENLKSITKTADILIIAIGSPLFITKDMVKPNSVIIDVGINRIVEDNSLCRIVGDVDFKNVSKIASHITPVPGGVGPMTIFSLLQNTFKSFCKRYYDK
jgi:methylenetetrahydrofolate dehydrogenase (NADP+) / methenyltetrahydrofolate cyclohydrolase